MNYHNITTDDMRNGDGLRTVLWVAGCDHHCDGWVRGEVGLRKLIAGLSSIVLE